MHPERRRQGCDGLDAVADGISSRARQGATSTAGFGAAVARVRVPGFPDLRVGVREQDGEVRLFVRCWQNRMSILDDCPIGAYTRMDSEMLANSPVDS